MCTCHWGRGPFLIRDYASRVHMYYVLLLIIGQSIEYGVKQALITARLCVENAF